MNGKVFLLAIVIAVLVGLVTAKGGRGGSYSSSRGGSRSYSRSTGSSRYSASNVRTWSSSRKSTAAKIGTIFIARRMRARYGSGDGWTDDSPVCQNQELYPEFNGSTSQYGWFLCPTDNVTADATHCCGDMPSQHCCNYWSRYGTGIIIGIVVSVVILLIGGGIFCFLRCRG